MFLTYQNSKIFYATEGQGNPLVLIHGFLESSNIWNELSDKVSSNRQIICLDLPGHGKSGCIGEIHTMEEMAEVLREVLKKLNIQKADFIGHSMGGYVLLAFLEKYPKMVNKLILLNSTPAADSDEKKEIRKRSIALAKRNKEAYVSMSISNLLSEDHKGKYINEINELKENAKNFPTQGITASLQGMKIRKDRSEVLKSFSGIKYLLAGTRDPLLNFEELKDLASYCGCEFFFFSGGHLSLIENKTEIHDFVYFIE